MAPRSTRFTFRVSLSDSGRIRPPAGGTNPDRHGMVALCP